MQSGVEGRRDQFQVVESPQQYLSSVRKDMSSRTSTVHHGGVLHRPEPDVASQGPESLRRGVDIRSVPHTQLDPSSQNQWQDFMAMQNAMFLSFMKAQRHPDAQKSPHPVPSRQEETLDDDERLLLRTQLSPTRAEVTSQPSPVTQQPEPEPEPEEIVLRAASDATLTDAAVVDEDEDCIIISSDVQPVAEVPVPPDVSAAAPTTTSTTTTTTTTTSDEPDNLRHLREQVALEKELARLRSLNQPPPPPPVQRSVSLSDARPDPDAQVSPPIDRDTLMSRRIPVNRDFVNQLSPVKSPFKRLMGSGRVRSADPGSPSSLEMPVGQEVKDDNSFRNSIKVLLDFMPDVASTTTRHKAHLPDHFETIYKASGRPKILLPPHPSVASNFQYVQTHYVNDKKTPLGEYKSTAKYSSTDVFQPKKSWSRAETSFDAGPDVSFLMRDRHVENRAMKLFDFKSIQNFQKPLTAQYQLNKNAASTLIRNTKNGMASASYQAHFLEALKLNQAELHSSVTSASLPQLPDDCPPEVLSKLQDWFQDLQDQLTTSSLRSEVLLQGAKYASDFSASFHVFNDVLESQFRRDQYLSHLKPFLQHHRLEMRDAPFDSSNVFPCLEDVLSQADQETNQSATFAIADALASGWQSGRSGNSRRQDSSSNNNNYQAGGDRNNRSRGRGRDNRRDNRSDYRSRSRSRNRDNGQGVRRDQRDDNYNSRGRGRGNNNNRNYDNNRGGYQNQSRSSRRNQRRGNVAEGPQDQQPKSQQSK